MYAIAKNPFAHPEASTTTETSSTEHGLFYLQLTDALDLDDTFQKRMCLKASCLMGALIARQKQLNYFKLPNFSKTFSPDQQVETRVCIYHSAITALTLMYLHIPVRQRLSMCSLQLLCRSISDHLCVSLTGGEIVDHWPHFAA